MEVVDQVRVVRQRSEGQQQEPPVYDVLLGDAKIGEVTRSAELTYYGWLGISVTGVPGPDGRRLARRVYEKSRRDAAASLLRIHLERS